MPVRDRYKIEVVVDVADDYVHYEVTPVGETNPVFELNIAADKSLNLVFYVSSASVRISMEDIESICQEFKAFAPQAIENGDAAKAYFKSL